MTSKIVICSLLTFFLLTVCSHSGAAADEDPPDRVPRWCLPFH